MHNSDDVNDIQYNKGIDTSDPYNPTVISTISNSTWLFYSTHLSFDPVRSLLFVASAGNGTEGSGVGQGHSITSISVRDARLKACFACCVCGICDINTRLFLRHAYCYEYHFAPHHVNACKRLHPLKVQK